MKHAILILMLLIATSVFSQTLEYPNIFYAEYDSTTTSIDTLSRQINSSLDNLYTTFDYYFQVIFAPDSTTQISTDTKFSANRTWVVRGGESWTSPKFDMTITNLYWKRYGGTGIGIMRFSLWGR